MGIEQLKDTENVKDNARPVNESIEFPVIYFIVTNICTS